MFGAKNKIKLDPDLYDRAVEYASERGYSSVEEFVTHLIEGAIGSQGGADSDKAIKDRLSGLGYIS